MICCMVFDSEGNAIDGFDWTPEELRAAARRCAGDLTITASGAIVVVSASSSLDIFVEPRIEAKDDA